MSGEGKQQLDNLTAAGFNSDDANNWQMQKRQELSGAGFSQAEVDDYFGQKTFNDQPLRDHIDGVMADAAAAAKGDGEGPAKPFTFSDAIKAGWQNSTAGLMSRQAVPDTVLPKDNTWLQRIAFNTTSAVGDIPAGVTGALIGGGAGAETGPGAAVTAMGGAFALPAALRATMMDAYGKGEFHSASDFVSRASGIMVDSAKAYVTGASMAAGGMAGKAVAGKVGAGVLATTASEVGGGVAAATTAAAAMDGRLPEPKDFLDMAAVALTFHAVPYLAGKVGDIAKTVNSKIPEVASTLREIYKQTGTPPSDVINDAKVDPTIVQDIVANPGEVPDAYKAQIDPYFAPKEAAEPTTPEPPEAGTLEEAQKNILDKIQVGGEDQSPARDFDTFYTKVIDNMHPLQKSVEEMSGEPAAAEGTNPYILARLTRGAYGKADQFLTQSPFKFGDYKNVGKSLEDIITPFKGDLDGVRTFLAAKRAQELEGRDINSGFDLDSANKVVDGTGDKYAGVQKDLVDYQNHLTQYLQDSGVISAETKAAMNEANKNYVPFFRVFDNEGLTSGGAGKGIGTKNPIKAIKGSDRAIIDPIESIIKNTYTYLAMADRNEVAQSYIDMAKATENPEQFAKKINPPIRGVTVSDEEMTKFLQDQGMKEVPDDLLTVFRAARQPLEDDQIAVFTDGKREVYQVNPDVASVFKAADVESANWLFRIIAAPAGMFRAGVTLSPDFFPRNLVRDQFDALINSRNGFVPLLDTVRGAASMIKQDDSYQNWLKSGGANATMVTLDRDYIQNNVIKLNEETGFRDAAWNVVKSPFDALRVVSELAENATRLGEFKKAYQNSIDAGVDEKSAIQNAGFQSREVTLDFARIGSKTQALNMLVAFWNAQVQGIDRLGRRFAENPLGTAAKIGASITLPSVALWWANHDDPRYKDIPDWQKDMFWIVMTKDNIYRIPKPHEAGILFGSGIERFLDYTKTQNPKAISDYTADVMQSFAPGYVPTVAQPFIEQFANKSLFTGGKIVPSSTEQLLPEVQYQPYTTELAKALGGIVGTLPPENKPGTIASPAIMENYIRQWSGGLGMYALQLADAGLRKAGVLPDPIMPTSTLADIPFIKAFVVRYPSAGAQPIQDFYDSYEKKMQVLNTIKYLDKSGDVAAGIKMANMNPDALAGQMTGVKQALTAQQKFIQMTYKMPFTDKKPEDLTPEERTSIANQKRQIIEGAYYQMIQTAHMGNDLMRQVDQGMAK